MTTTASTPISRVAARILIETQSVLFKPDDPFTLTSGRKSPVYVDCRRLIAFPRARRRLMKMGAATIEEKVGFESLDVVAGGETAGIPFAAWISDHLMLPMCYIRKKPKGFGRNARIEGALAEGQRVILVEDMATDGGSKLSFVDGIRDAGAVCHHTFVIFHYGIFPEGEKALADHGVALHSLATWWDVLECAKEDGYFKAGQADQVEAFLHDPIGWSKAMGGSEE
ncbi:MAG: orotate phosphoribosyltransferase [Rhodospirillaceae bacterium]|jgi:orotate phosphoribosyltransferase|uniref:orotate phosphoribosyltransferase n=1 Tax=unclassified Hwanghaeella TaxID=2605944 RepID=UPI000C570714|nr:orotate phosphoribosyltransferase [Rhodospirillales bacterium]MAX47418.1 orotate phosphoribosyltransferase [Rhodospirillaceae bacterium]|tara:strand:+ start:652 stop:1329 length:678 start_codon:yes stop_codon:yes gene_type:complete